jgi:hypothetical protein
MLGGSASISARWQTIEILTRFAEITRSHDATLWLWDTDTLDGEALAKIAAAGGKNVIIDIRISSQELPRHTSIAK